MLPAVTPSPPLSIVTLVRCGAFASATLPVPVVKSRAVDSVPDEMFEALVASVAHDAAAFDRLPQAICEPPTRKTPVVFTSPPALIA